MDDTLSRLTVASPRALLEELARGRRPRERDRARPEAECYLASGQILRGRIVTVIEERGGPIALLHTAGTCEKPTVAYVRIDQLGAVVVADASLLVRGAQADAPVPTRLELARQVQARGEALVTVVGHPLPLTLAAEVDDDARRAIALALPILVEVLAAIASDAPRSARERPRHRARRRPHAKLRARSRRSCSDSRQFSSFSRKLAFSSFSPWTGKNV